jgi:D-apionolactonase
MNASVLACLYGTDEALPREVELRAGTLSMTLRGARIVDLKVAGYEVWHGVTFLYRDPDWGTPEPVFQHIVHEVEGEGFSLQLEGYIPTQPAIDLLITLHGDSQGTVKLQAHAVPRGDLLANRIGLCLLHPMHAMGRALEVEHVDGRISRSVFPEQVPPWPPFTGVRGIRHEFAPGHWAQVRFQGDDFEFEDQRNNADASFKTYSRSNNMPRPYVLRSGAAIDQSLTLRIEPAAVKLDPAPAQAPVIDLHKYAEVARMPQLGLAIAPDDAQASPLVLAALADISPSLLHLTLSLPDQPVRWTGIARLLSLAGAQLRLDLLAGVTAASLAQLAMVLRNAGITPESVAIFPATPSVVTAARQAFPASSIGGGTPHFFAQFNRMDDVGPADFLGFTVCPTVHGADDAAPMAGLQSLPSLLATARARYPGRALRIGPSGLGARSSPLGRQPPSDGTRRMALAQRDPRTRGLFGAAWLLGHVAQAARAGAEAVSMMSLRGDAGVLDETSDGRLLRNPTFFVLVQLARLTRLRAVTVSDARRVVALTSACDSHADWLIANLTAQAVDLTVGGGVSTRVMDVAAWQAYVSGKAASPWRELCMGRAGVLQLDAFAIAIAPP